MCIRLIPLFFLYLYAYNDAVQWKDVTSLTLHAGQLTTGRRVAPVQQLSCTGGAAAEEHKKHPKLVQCTQTGFDGSSYQYKCEATLDETVKFGQTKVSCEGYHHKDDQMVLVGSCALRYTLEYTGIKKQVEPQPKQTTTTTTTTTTTNVARPPPPGFMVSSIIIAIIVILVIGVMSLCCTKSNQKASFSAEKEYQEKKKSKRSVKTPRDQTSVSESYTTPTPSSLPQIQEQPAQYYTSISPPPVSPVQITTVHTHSTPVQTPSVIIVNNSPSSRSLWDNGYNRQTYDSLQPIITTTTTTTSSVQERIDNYHNNVNSSQSTNPDTYKATTYCGSEGR